MSEPSSVRTGRSSANVRGIHPEDHESLRELVHELNRLRVNRGMGIGEASRRSGRERAWLRNMVSGKSSTESWDWYSMFLLAKAVGYTLWMNVELPGEVLEHLGPMTQMASRSPQLGGVAMLEYLRDYRLNAGVEQKATMEAQGVKRSSAWGIENSDNPRIATIMRYARALDGRITFILERIDKPEEEAFL